MSDFGVLFQITGGGGGSSSDYTKDAFLDISKVPSSNTGFSSTVSKNPFNQYFLNDDAPKYGTKVLWVKDLVLIKDRTKWLSNKPTYQVVFNENYPGVYAYCAGNIRLKTLNQGRGIEILNIDDIFGVTGVMRRVSFIVNSSDQATGTADIVVDGVDTGSDISFGNAPTDSTGCGYNKFHAFPHGSSNETKDIHDYRLTCNEFGTLSLTGIIVYYENATTNIDLFPGNTYVDKTLSTTQGITTLAVGTLDRNGGRVVITKTNAANYSTSSVEAPIKYSNGSGTSGGSSVDVTTGHGASFPAGTAIVVPQGSSFYLGNVTSVSTDTLTVAPTLPFNLSAGSTLWSLWRSGPTLSIGQSLYQLAYSFDVGSGNVFGNADGFNITTPKDSYWQSPDLKYRIWGDAFNVGTQDGNLGIYWAGVSLGFLQVDGYFSSAEIEFAGNGILHATFTVNGLNAYGINEGFTGIQKKTVFTNAGPGWNSFVMTPGSSFGNCVITKINLYETRQNLNATLGVLANYDIVTTKIFRPAINATLAQLGTYRRIYADSLYLNGHWARGTTHTAAGGVFYVGSSTTSNITFYYYGKDYAVVGTAGASTSLSFDGGAATFMAFNAFNSVATEGFHKVSITNASSQTLVIDCIDFTKTVGEFNNQQNFIPRSELDNIPQVYNQWDTPRAHLDGSSWMRDKYNGDYWVWFGDRWFRVKTDGQSEDPNASQILYYGGNT